jgi:PAS domain S-box-containing protein
MKGRDTEDRVAILEEAERSRRAMLSLLEDQQRNLAALRESEERFRKVFEEGPLGMAMLSVSEGKFIRANDAFCRMSGYSEEELKRLSFADITHTDDRTRDVEGVKALWAGQISRYQTEKRYVTKTGATFWGSLTVSLVHGADGTPLYSLAMVENIDERKRAETEKVRLEAELRQAQKMESVGRLAGGVAHDFNNMLSAILGHAEFALARVDPTEPLHADLEEIRKAATRSAGLTHQLLAFARKQTVAPRVLDLNEIVAGMLDMLRRLVGEDIDLVWQPGMDLQPIRMDPSQIDQILANLCVNARDAVTGTGRIMIESGRHTFTEDECAAHPGMTPGGYALLAVSDNGTGMDTETLSHLFEPFFTTKPVGDGTGLGLATVYGIVRQNNGAVEVVSEPNRGATFRIYLPEYVGPREQRQTEGDPVPTMCGHETILLVEDEPAVLAVATRILAEQGYTVLAAAAPGEAIRIARVHTGELHLLVTDVVMPEMTGRALAKNLLSLYPRLKCLFTSGYTADVIAHHGVLDEGVQFIQKPFSVGSLSAKVREVLNSDDADVA